MVFVSSPYGRKSCVSIRYIPHKSNNNENNIDIDCTESQAYYGEKHFRIVEREWVQHETLFQLNK